MLPRNLRISLNVRNANNETFPLNQFKTKKKKKTKERKKKKMIIADDFHRNEYFKCYG